MSSKLMRCLTVILFCWICLHSGLLSAQATSSRVGIFEGQADIGKVVPAGTLNYSPKTGAYTLTAAGWDLWSTEDGFHFVWKKLSGDLSLTADIDFPVKTGEHSLDIAKQF